MSTNKSLLKAYLEPDTKKKLDYLAKVDKRSASNLIEVIAENYIKDYESKHGKLIVDEDGTIHPKQERTKDNSVKSSAFKAG